jgi:hypothetical protein
MNQELTNNQIKQIISKYSADEQYAIIERLGMMYEDKPVTMEQLNKVIESETELWLSFLAAWLARNKYQRGLVNVTWTGCVAKNFWFYENTRIMVRRFLPWVLLNPQRTRSIHRTHTARRNGSPAHFGCYRMRQVPRHGRGYVQLNQSGDIERFMTNERWKQLSESHNCYLKPSEISEGWHWCNEFDGLLVGPGSHELNNCTCWPKKHPVYLTKPPEPEYPIDLTGVNLWSQKQNPRSRLKTTKCRLLGGVDGWCYSRLGCLFTLVFQSHHAYILRGGIRVWTPHPSATNQSGIFNASR